MRAPPTRSAWTSSRTARCWTSARDNAGAVERVETTRGTIRTPKVGVVAAGHTSVVMQRAGLRMPLESFPLQALVSEPVKPMFPCVVMSNTVHAYISQSDKGELVIGAGTDQYVSYSQTGGLHIATHTLEAICELFPMFTRLRMLRNWGGIVDVTPDRSPIIGKTPVKGLYVNCGWGTGGFKATPGSGHVFAHTIAHDSAASHQCAVHPGALRDRAADRRGGRGRGCALMLLIRCPYCGAAPGDRVPRRRRGTHRARRAIPRSSTTTRWASFSSSATTRRACTPSAGSMRMAAAAGSTPCATRSATGSRRPTRSANNPNAPLSALGRQIDSIEASR